MTNLKDLLNDFAEDIVSGMAEISGSVDKNKPNWMDKSKEFKDENKITYEEWTEKKEQIIEEYIDIIKERLIG